MLCLTKPNNILNLDLVHICTYDCGENQKHNKEKTVLSHHFKMNHDFDVTFASILDRESNF